MVIDFPKTRPTEGEREENDFLIIQANLAAINARFEGARAGREGFTWASTMERLLAGLIHSLTGLIKGRP